MTNEPSNCKWATPLEQAQNTRKLLYIEFRGQRLTHKQWEQLLGFPIGKLHTRLSEGFSVERALTQPLRKHFKRTEQLLKEQNSSK